MLDKKGNIHTLPRLEEFLRICSEEDLAKKAQGIIVEVRMPVLNNQEKRYNLNPVSSFIDRFWDRRPDGVAINERLYTVSLQTVYILGFKRSPNRYGWFLSRGGKSKSN